VVLIQSIVIFKKKGGTSEKWSPNYIGCDDDDDDDEEEVDSDDDMEYTEDAIDNMILEFSRD
jgi:hypothetical protein